MTGYSRVGILMHGMNTAYATVMLESEDELILTFDGIHIDVFFHGLLPSQGLLY
jgi:hypothetical protein